MKNLRQIIVIGGLLLSSLAMADDQDVIRNKELKNLTSLKVAARETIDLQNIRVTEQEYFPVAFQDGNQDWDGILDNTKPVCYLYISRSAVTFNPKPKVELPKDAVNDLRKSQVTEYIAKFSTQNPGTKNPIKSLDCYTPAGEKKLMTLSMIRSALGGAKFSVIGSKDSKSSEKPADVSSQEGTTK